MKDTPRDIFREMVRNVAKLERRGDETRARNAARAAGRYATARRISGADQRAEWDRARSGR